jgi:ABC-2 type transport system permease protein
MTVIYGSAFSALGLVMDFRSGVIDRYLSTPVSRAAIVLARVLDGSVGVTIQSLLVLLLSIALGVRLAAGPAGVLVILAAAFLLAAIFAAFASWIALSTRDEQSLVGTIQFLAMPLVFLSSVLLPVALMPGWLARVVAYNPVEWATRAARSLVLSGWDVSLLLRSFGPLLALAAALTALSIVTFRRGAL